MITKIDGDRILVVKHGLLPGSYYLEYLSAEDLVLERNKLQGYLLYARKIEPTENEVMEIAKIEKIIERLSNIITEKCKENQP